VRIRALSALLLLSLPGAAAAETFQVGPDAPGGTTFTTTTQLRKGETYRITISGTLTVVHTSLEPPRTETYDAFYCASTDWPERRDSCGAAGTPDASIAADQGFGFTLNLNSTAGTFAPYEGDHSYSRKVVAPGNGPATFSTRPFSPTPQQTWSGAFTVTIQDPGAKLCGKAPATIVGEDEPGPVNRIIGTPGNDVILGTAAKDLILGGGGTDVICAGGGADHVNGGGGNDTILGGAGPDTIVGNTGDDTAEGGSGDDHLKGSAGIDELQGNGDDDVLDSGPAETGPEDEEFLEGGPGNDELIARNRFTVFNYSHAGAGIQADLAKGIARGQGRDKLSGPGILQGTRFADTLLGSGDADEILGLAGDDTLKGRGDSDVLSGGEGADTVDGGEGNDRCSDAEQATACESR
jgi:Ca2+-binding RTX toxin-like protein